MPNLQLPMISRPRADALATDITANILVVDDRPDKLLSLTAVLGELKHNVMTATSGKEAIRLLLQHDFAVILLDVSMPIMDGFETAAIIRQRDKSSSIPIIFVTAISSTDNHVSRGYSLGAVDYIFTPIIPEILRAKVAVFIDLHVKSVQLKRQSEWMRDEAERRAHELETRMRRLMNRLNVGVYRAAPNGKIIEANPAFLRLFGITLLSEVEALDLRALFQPGPEGSSALVDAQANPPTSVDVLLRRADGQPLWVFMTRAYSLDSDGQPFIEGLVEDITVRKSAEEALAVKKDELERSNAELEQFAYVASHDLQEPLRMVSSYLSLLHMRYHQQLDAKAAQFIKFSIDGAERMQVLINDLLVYSRLTNDNEAAAIVDCEEALRDALSNLQAPIGESKAVITHEPLPKVVIPHVRLVVLLQNLIGNAIKFCRQHPPEIHLLAERSERSWIISVRDNGIGIEMENAKRIFDIFQRLHSQAEYPGTGIGLASCKKIVECSGGRIWVTSQVGEGSTFHFTVLAPPDDR